MSEREAPAISLRNREILALVASGQTTKTMAFGTGLSVSAIEKHLHQLFVFYGVANRAELVSEAHKRGDLR